MIGLEGALPVPLFVGEILEELEGSLGARVEDLTAVSRLKLPEIGRDAFDLAGLPDMAGETVSF